MMDNDLTLKHLLIKSMLTYLSHAEVFLFCPIYLVVEVHSSNFVASTLSSMRTANRLCWQLLSALAVVCMFVVGVFEREGAMRMHAYTLTVYNIPLFNCTLTPDTSSQEEETLVRCTAQTAAKSYDCIFT